MEQITLIRKNGEEVKLFSTSPIRFVNSAGQQSDLMSVDTVKLIITSADLIEFGIGDKIVIVADEYFIRSTSTREIVSENQFVYEVTFYGVIYELIKSQYRDADAQGNSSRSTFDLTYELKDFIKVLIYNTNRDYPNRWTFDYDNCPATEPRTITFSKQNCLQVLQNLCKDFGYDFAIRQQDGIRTIKIGTLGTVITPPDGQPHFEYGKGKGLYDLKEKKVDDQAIITRLWVEGGTQNIKSNYRDYSERLQLPLHRMNKNSHTLYDGTVIPANSEYIGISSESDRYIEDEALSNLIGVVEDTKHYDHIYPQRTGTVTALGGDIYSFIDSSMNFDLNEKDGAGNTLYLVNGVSAKINFITGRLAGQQFELSNYDPGTKAFKIIKYTDERGLSFPTESGTAFRIEVGNRYKITDINLPQSYIDDAEEDLWYAGYNDFLKRKQARVSYDLTFDPMYFKNALPPDSETVVFRPGDYVPIKDERFGIEKNIRIQSVKRDLLKEHDYSLTLSDSTTISVINETIKDVIEHNTIIERNKLKDFSKARMGWRTTEELRNMIYDPDGYFDTGNIKPESIDTAMLTVGVKSQQFILSGVVMQANTNGNPNRFDASSGVLAHLTIDEDNARLWNMSGLTVNLTDSGGYYVYARCVKNGTIGVWHVTQQQLKVEEISDPNNYYFQVGIIGSLHPDNNFRDFVTTHGFTRINGNTITTGRIVSLDGKISFDLDNGRLDFFSSGSKTDLETWAVNINNLQIGGVNLLLNSKRQLSGTSYNIGYFTAVRDFVPGEKLTVTIKGNIPSARLFGLWFNSASLGTGSIPKIKDGYYQLKITVPAATTTRVVGLYLVDNQSAVDSWGFEWIKLEAGDKVTLEWSAPTEELQAEITRVETETKTRFQINENGIAANVTAITSVQSNVTGLTTRVSATESQLTIQAGQINQRVTQTVYDANNVAISTQIAQINIKADNINIKVDDAKAEAISTAASDATTKANNVRNIVSAITEGRMLYKDPLFSSGLNNTNKYNNGSGVTSLTRIAKPADAPTTGSYILRYTYTSGSPSPGFGGFYFGTLSRANAVFITKIIAKIPTGKTINWASNAIGSNGDVTRWLTSQTGTGRYATYICQVVCGSEGTFSSTNYFYFTGGSGAFDVDIAYATVFDVTLYDNTEEIAKQYADSGIGSAVAGLKTDLSGTGIDITVKKLTLYSGAGGGSAQGKIVIAGSNFSVDENGYLKAVNGDFSGKITATSGQIGGFNIGASYIGAGSSWSGSTSGMSLWEDFIVFNKPNRQALIGATSSLGFEFLGRFSDTGSSIYDKVGVIFNITGSSGNNTAISLGGGHIAGFAVRTRQIGAGTTLTRADVVVTCYFSNDSQYVYMPSSPEVGELKLVFNINARSVNMRGNGKSFKQGNGGVVWANFSFGPSHDIKNSCMFVWDGQYWIIMSI